MRTDICLITVIDRYGFFRGRVEARVGLETYSGPVTRWTAKGSFATMGSSGEERMWKKGNHQPCVYQSKLKKSDTFYPKAEAAA